MLQNLSRTRRNWALAFFAALVLWFCWRIREVLNPLLLGYLLAFILHPAVQKLEGRGWSRTKAVNVIFAGSGLVGGVLALVLLWQGSNLSGLLTNTPILERIRSSQSELFATVQKWLPEDMLASLSEGGAEVGEGEPGGELGIDLDKDPEGAPAEPDAPAVATESGDADDGGSEVLEDAAPMDADVALVDGESGAASPGPESYEDLGLVEVLQGIWRNLSPEQAADAGQFALRGAGGLWASFRHWFGSALGLGFLLVLLPVYTYFLLFELGRIHGFVARYIPVRQRALVVDVGRQIGEVISSFFRGRLIVCLLKGLAMSLGLALIGTDYALLLGMTGGFLSLVPFFGPFGGFLFAIVVGLAAPGTQPLGLVLRTGVVFALAELFEGYYLVPKILGDSLGLHPVVVLFAVFAGGATLGMFGFLIALPLTATIVILIKALVLPALAAFADEEPEPVSDGPESPA